MTSISDLVNQGFRLYRAPDPIAVDCPAMRQLEDHLWHLADLCEEPAVRPAATTTRSREAVGQEWPRVSGWLRMAAGLQYVDLDTAYGERDLVGWCGPADAHNAAASEVASVFFMEQTRFLYAWNAAERLLRVLRLPSAPEVRGRYNRATQMLKSHWDEREPLVHFDCVLRHLEVHARTDAWLRDEQDLQRCFEERPWRSRSGFLLAAANQLRHLPAHGALDLPRPATWGADEPRGAKQVTPLLHAPRLAARGLALSLQMLLLAAEASSSAALERAHLRPPETTED